MTIIKVKMVIYMFGNDTIAVNLNPNHPEFTIGNKQITICFFMYSSWLVFVTKATKITMSHRYKVQKEEEK